MSVLVQDKNGNRKTVNDFIGNNADLLKRYGYTPVNMTEDEKKSGTKSPESQPLSPAVEVDPVVTQEMVDYAKTLDLENMKWGEITKTVNDKFSTNFSWQTVKSAVYPNQA